MPKGPTNYDYQKCFTNNDPGSWRMPHPGEGKCGPDVAMFYY